MAGHRIRKPTRLRTFDYSTAGLYFVSVCSYGRKKIFSDVVDDDVVLTDLGRIVERVWQAIPAHFPGVWLDVSIVMPDHFHGIIALDGSVSLSTRRHPANQPSARDAFRTGLAAQLPRPRHSQ